jgi:hypothetical protein
MSTLGAILLSLIVLGMLLAYYVGYAVGRHDGREQGRQEGKREGAVRAYAVGYDRGRHDRRAKGSKEPGEPAAPSSEVRGCAFWLLPVLVSLLAVIAAAAYGSLKFHP